MDWMNSSGISVGKVVRATKTDPDDVMVIHDDMDFDFGTFKIKPGGSSGRHNGVQSVIDHIGKNFVRFRIGVGRPMDETPSRDYVLSEFETHEKKCFCKLIGLATRVVDCFVEHGVQQIMSIFNRRKV